MRGRIKNVGGAPLKEVSTEGKAKRVSYHTKRYTDWAKEAIKNVRPVDTVVTKEGPNVLERFDYTKEKGEIFSSLNHKKSGFDSTDLMTTRKSNEDEEDVVVGEEEAKERAAQFIVRMEKKGWCGRFGGGLGERSRDQRFLGQCDSGGQDNRVAVSE